jgi:hypothetical protein
LESYESVYIIIKVNIPNRTNHEKARKGKGAGRFIEGRAPVFTTLKALGMKNVIRYNFRKCLRYLAIDVRQHLFGRCFIIIALFLKHGKVKHFSNTMVHFIGPSSPIIEDLKPIPDGLNISWKSDVKTRQDKFEVTYNRNDTGKLT